MRKTRVEECYRLSIYAFAGRLLPGTVGVVSWVRAGEAQASVGFHVVDFREAAAIRLRYRITTRDGSARNFDDLVPLTTTPLPWGGVRNWFICPLIGCGRRVACIYAPWDGRPFGCRICYDLSYASKQTRDLLGRAFRGVLREWAKARHRDGGDELGAESSRLYVSPEQLSDQSGLTAREVAQLHEAHLLVPDTKAGLYRAKLVGWAGKLAFLLRQGWDIAEIKDWARERWTHPDPRRWPPERAR